MYFYIIIPALILALYAQGKVSSTFNKYSRYSNRRNLTGAQVAEMMLQDAGIYDVQVERVAGNLTDHYDPRNKKLRLSDSVYSSNSVAAIGVAAHETGHAIQHAVGYGPLKLRSLMVPITSFGSRAAMPLIVLGILFGLASETGYLLIQLGIIFFAVAALFALVTLPVEFNASSRAIALLGEKNILYEDELVNADKVLKAAAMTYVASAAMAVAQLLRLFLLFGRRDD